MFKSVVMMSIGVQETSPCNNSCSHKGSMGDLEIFLEVVPVIGMCAQLPFIDWKLIKVPVYTQYPSDGSCSFT